MLKKLKGLFIEEKGQGMAEYGLILGLVAVVLIAVLVAFGGKIKGIFENITNNSDLNTAVPDSGSSTTTTP